MHVESFIQDSLRAVAPKMHETRFLALSEMVCAALRGACVTVTGLGRAIGGETKEKHCIKRADRLVSNPKLLPESIEIYASMARRILGNLVSPTIVVDWSTLNEGSEIYLLRASSPAQGRALTLYEEIHPLSGKDNPDVHRRFLQKLQQILPVNCRPVIVTDAGFRTPWFREVQRRGWDFVGRIRNRNLIQIGENNQWISAKDLYQKASSVARSVGSVLLTRSNPLQCEFVLYLQKARGRMEQTVRGKRAKRSQSRKHARREQEPWLLATSLAIHPREIVSLYRTRMQIEESFRDLKSTRYGLSLELSGTKKLSRMAILVMIASLALWLSWLLGKAAQILGLHRSLQANTVRTRTVLSPTFLGLRAFNSVRIKLTMKAINEAQQLLSIAMRRCCYDS